MKMFKLESSRPILLTGAWLLSSMTLFAQPPREPPPRPSAQPAAPDPAPADEVELITMVKVVNEPTHVSELLDALESADKGIETFQAKLMYDRQFLLQGDRHVRYGSLAFRVEPAAGGKVKRTFAITFDKLFVDDEMREEKSTWAFDGQWLIEKRPAEKQFIKRQLALPEDPIDPLGLGESPLPFPIGQRKAAILERYEAEMLKPEEGITPDPDEADDPAVKEEAANLLVAARETYQLRLVPRDAYARDDNFKEIRLWYTKDRFLPRMAMAVNRAGDISIVKLINIELNETLPRHAIDTSTPDEPGWDIQIEERRFLKNQPEEDNQP